MDTNLNSNTILSSLSNCDPDINIPIPSNFAYYSTQEFRNSHEIQACIASKHFSVLHANIRSINANHDNFKDLLFELNHNFKVIGLTETS